VEEGYGLGQVQNLYFGYTATRGAGGVPKAFTALLTALLTTVLAGLGGREPARTSDVLACT
jgi:hypothetical protein